MSEVKKGKPKYPTTLDVVVRDGKEFQVIASGQTGKQSSDLFVLKDPETGEVHRVSGAKFIPTRTSEPGVGNIHKREEGVRVTGSLDGGSRQK